MFRYLEVLNVCLRSAFVFHSSWDDSIQECDNNRFVLAKWHCFGMKNKLRGSRKKKEKEKWNSIHIKGKTSIMKRKKRRMYKKHNHFFF